MRPRPSGTSKRVGRAPGGAEMSRHVLPSSLRASDVAVDARARRPSASNATANTGPTSSDGASCDHSRPALRDRRSPLSVASSKWFGSTGFTVSARAPLTIRPGFVGDQVMPPSRERKSPPYALGSWALACVGDIRITLSSAATRRRGSNIAVIGPEAGRGVSSAVDSAPGLGARGWLRLARLFSGRECDLGQARVVRPGPEVLRERILVRVGERLVCGDAVLVAARDLVALLVGQELLDRVGLLRVCDHPVADPFPRRIGVASEDQLADRRRYFEELRAGGVGSVGRVNDDAGGDLHGAVDDDRFAAQNLPVDFLQRERRIAAGRRAGAAAL